MKGKNFRKCMKKRSHNSIPEQKDCFCNANVLLFPGNKLGTMCWTAKKGYTEYVTQNIISKGISLSV